jgi:predicted nucleotidyltransferase
MSTIQVELPREALRAFCARWNVRELSLFGSVLRDDFRPDSDLDVLVSFDEEAHIGLWDMAQMVSELESMFGRKVDLVEKEALSNPYRKKAILNHREIVYAA